MSDTLVATPSKKISQFQIRPACPEDDGITGEPPVKIAPPPVSIKRSKSLKQERTKFSRNATVPNAHRETLTLPRRAVIVTQKSAEDLRKPAEKPTPTTASPNPTAPEPATTAEERAPLPEPAPWQAVVNTHRRGSSMTFVSTENWASFDTPSALAAAAAAPPPAFDWRISSELWSRYGESFHSIKPLHGFISGKQSREFLSTTGLSRESLAQIWDLSDMDHDGSLSLAEFSIALHCISAVEAGEPLPGAVPTLLKESLLHHVTNTALTTAAATAAAGSLAAEERTPEKSALKSSGSLSKGASVHFKEDPSESLLSRSRPRPTRKLVTTTPLHLKPNQLPSSSSYYSSDNSDSEPDQVARQLEMTKSSSSKKSRSKKDRDSTQDSSNGLSSSATVDTDVTRSPMSKSRRDRTYDDPADFLAKLEIDAGDEDVEALIQPSDNENDFGPSSPPPSSPPPTGPPLTRAPTRPNKAPPPTRQPSRPTLPPPCSPPPGTLPSTTEEEGHSSSSYKEESDANHRGVEDPEGYERLGDPDLPPAIMLDQGECVESDEDGFTPRPADEEEEEQEERDAETNLPVFKLERPGRGSRSASLQPVSGSMLCDDVLPPPTFLLQQKKKDDDAMCGIAERFKITKEEIAACPDELKFDALTDMWSLDDVPETEVDMEDLQSADAEELRREIGKFELRNRTLVNLIRALRIELLKIQEEKLSLIAELEQTKK